MNTKFPIKLISGNSDSTPFTGPSGPKCSVKVRIDVPDEKQASAIITYLSSPVFRAEFDAAKAELGLGNYGMDVGRIYPLVSETDGKRTVKAYIREIKLTRSV